MKAYTHKMQTVVPVSSALEMIDIFGADFFTQINIRQIPEYEFLEENIQLPHGEGEEALKSIINDKAKKHSDKLIRVELIKK